jgi:hypothetical protein
VDVVLLLPKIHAYQVHCLLMFHISKDLLIDPLSSTKAYTVISRYFVFEGNGENERNMCENKKS